MAVQFRDYYEVLGVSRDADTQEIKQAFKKLARQCHPDVAKDKASAEERFKEVNEAYEVLSDPEKRKKYDLLGKNWKHGADFTPPRGAGGFGFDPHGEGFEYHFGGSTGFSDFFENLFGSRNAGDPFGAFSRGARGGPLRGQDIESDLLVSIQEVIHGGERVIQLRGQDSRTLQTIKIKIPKGVAENQLIRCGGLGNPGLQGGERGDLYLRVKYERHPDFRFEGRDVFGELQLSPWDCVLGTGQEINTPQGKVRIAIPAGTQPGTKLRIRNHGLPDSSGGKGDFYLEIFVSIPAKVTPEQREHWEALAKLANRK